MAQILCTVPISCNYRQRGYCKAPAVAVRLIPVHGGEVRFALNCPQESPQPIEQREERE